MSQIATVETLLDAAMTLSVDDRLRLMEAIRDTVPDEAPLTVPPELRAKLDGRLAELRANPGIAVTWEQIKARFGQTP